MAEKAAQESKTQKASQPEVEQTEAPESSHSGPFADLIHLQQSAGNRAVSALLKSSGQPLDTVTRARMEAGFGADFGNVRLHTGAGASRTAREIDAAAYTVGEDIVLNRDFYSPETTAGSQLLAHELAHVVQQRHTGTVAGISQPGDAAETGADMAAGALIGGLGGGLGALSATGGPVPAVQRQTTAEANDLQRRAELDQLRATLTDALYSSAQHSPTSVLIGQAIILNNNFDETFASDLPRTRVATAEALVRIYHELKSREQTAERDQTDNALLYSDITGERPWTEGRPTRVEDIPIFSEENVFDWLTFGGPGAIAEREAAERSQGGRRQPRQVQAPPLADGSTAEITDEEIEQARTQPAPTVMIGSGLERQEETSHEQAAGQAIGAGPEVQSGLNLLRQTTVGQAHAAITRQLNEADDSEQAQVVPEDNQDSLFDATGLIWYVTNRLYSLDRTGHIVPGDFNFYLRGASLPPGVYFYGPFHFHRRSGGFAHNVLLRVSNGVAVSGGDLYPRSVLVDLIPLLEQGRRTLGRNAGIATIISSSFGEQRRLRDFSPGKLWDAVARAPRHVEWAVRSEITKIVENPAQEAVSQVFSLAMAQLGKMIPHVRLAFTAYQALRMAEWLGTTASIAAYGNEDETDIAAQSIARKVVEWTIGQLISKGISMGGRAARGAVRSRRQRREGEASQETGGTTTRREEAPATRERTSETPPAQGGQGQPSAPAQPPRTGGEGQPAQRPRPQTTPQQPRQQQQQRARQEASSPRRYDEMTLEQLRQAARQDRTAADALWGRYQRMSDRELNRRARNGDETAQAVQRQQSAQRNRDYQRTRERHGPADNPEMQRRLTNDIEAYRQREGIQRREPLPGEQGQIEGGTAAAARTDIPGLENRNFIGGSRRSRGEERPDHPEFRPPSTHGAAQGHAEQQVVGQLNDAIRGAGLTREQLNGKSVWLRVEQEVCSTCRAGLTNDSVGLGVLGQFSERFPELTIIIRSPSTSEFFIIRGGRRIN
jgi:hypothetical protein